MPEIVINLRMFRSSGIGTYLRNIVPFVVDALPEVRFDLLGDPHELEALPWSGRSRIKVIPLTAPTYSLAEQWGMVRRAPRSADLFWSPHYVIPLAWRGPLLVTIYDANHLALAKMLRPHHRLYAKFFFAMAARRAAHVVTISRFSRDELISHAGLSRDKISVVHCGVAAPSQEEAILPPPMAEPYLLFVGNVKPHKNLITLLRAFQLIQNEIPHKLVVVGRNKGLITRDDRFLREAEALGSRLTFTGEIGDAELDNCYRHATALVFPSLYEGFGLPPLEAMIRGCPVVASRAASIPEVCRDGALYCDPLDPADMAQQIKRVIFDQEARAALIQNGRAVAASYAWETAARAHVKIIESLLSGPP